MTGPLELQDVTVAFGGLRAIDNLSVVFGAGEITGLIGPNGSGKSTLVNTVSGQIRPAAGRIRFAGREITSHRADQIVRAGLARTYQIPRVPPQLTIGEIIGLPLIYVAPHRTPMPGLTDAAAIARFCGLTQPLDRLCAQLPVPDLRRLEIGRALACAPDTLLLDEVMAGLSPEESSGVVDVVRRIHEAGVSVVVIEHVMRVIAQLCHRVVVLNNGRLLAEGVPQAVLRDAGVRESYLGRGFVG
ncbi:MAG: ABC transporter ATP-binding protein [Acetobacteraceae bacterium]